jgi:nucleotide-binding universal stress UspA family protein
MNPDTSSPQEINHALICIGDKPLDPHALGFAQHFLHALDLQPTLLHVKQPETSLEQAEGILSAVREVPGYTTADSFLTEGNIRTEILDELKRNPYQMLVLGTSQRDPKSSVSPLSKRIALDTDTTVLAIQNPPQIPESFLICTGGHEASVPIVHWSIHLAKALDVSVTILHILSSPPAMYTGLPAVEEDLSQLLSRDYPLAHHLRQAAVIAEGGGVDAKLELRHGIVAEEILRACEMKRYDLVVIGAPSPSSRIEPLLLGQVAPHLLASSQKSTMIVRNHFEGRDS